MDNFIVKYNILQTLYTAQFPIDGRKYLENTFTMYLDSILYMAKKMIKLSYGLIHDQDGHTLIYKYRMILLNFGSNSKHPQMPTNIESRLDELVDAWCTWTKFKGFNQ